MKTIKFLGNILFWLTLFSPMVAFTLASTIGEPEIFDIAGMVRYSWVMWFFIPIAVLSILIGVKLKKLGESYKKNFIIAFICIPLIIIFGSYRFIFSDVVSYDVGKVAIVEDIIGLDLPNEIKIATMPFDSYTESYAKIIDEEAREKFEQELSTNELWQKELSTAINGLLPPSYQYETPTFDAFVFYNITRDEYNVFPPAGEYECIFIAYDYEAQRLFILDNYAITVH